MRKVMIVGVESGGLSVSETGSFARESKHTSSRFVVAVVYKSRRNVVKQNGHKSPRTPCRLANQEE